DDEAEAATRPKDAQQNGRRDFHVAHVLEDGEGVDEVEGAPRHPADDVLDEAVLERHVAEAIHAPGEADIGRGHFDRGDVDRWDPVAGREPDPTFTAPSVEPPAGIACGALALEQPVL